MRIRMVMLAAVAMAAVTAIASSADEAAIRALNAKFLAAFKARNTKAIKAMSMPDFTFKGSDGKVMDAKAALAMLESEFKQMPKSMMMTMNVTKIAVKGTMATAMVNSRFKAKMKGQDKKMHDYAGTSIMKQILEKHNGTWKFKSVEDIASKMTMDGKPFTPPAMGGTHK